MFELQRASRSNRAFMDGGAGLHGAPHHLQRHARRTQADMNFGIRPICRRARRTYSDIMMKRLTNEMRVRFFRKATYACGCQLKGLLPPERCPVHDQPVCRIRAPETVQSY